MYEQELPLLANEYATKDLYFAAFLHVKGLQIKKLEKYGRSRRGQNPVYFIFENKNKCTELESKFWNGVGDEVMINVKDYFTAIRDLRARAFSVSRIVSTIEGAGSVIEREEENEGN